eukprot:COSAG04_NODE_1358_length_7102_cov_9.598601_3_plen_90_part_00
MLVHLTALLHCVFVHRAFNHSLAAELSPCLAALAALFSSPTSADFFYPNDQKVIIDVLVRLGCPSSLLCRDAGTAAAVVVMLARRLLLS